MPLEPTLGQIIPAAYTVVPMGWAACNGQTLQVAHNQALFALLGVRFGGDGIRTFCLPDLRGRAVIGTPDPGQMGVRGGSATVTLTPGQMPSHSHRMGASTHAGIGSRPMPATGRLFGINTSGTPVEQIFSLPGSAAVPLANGTNVQYAGGGQPHDNMQPYLTIGYLIALQGVFPMHL